MVHSDLVLEVAGAVIDGVTVDWASVERSATSDEDRSLLAELRFIAETAQIGAGSCSPRDTFTLTKPAQSVAKRTEPTVAPDGSEVAFNRWGPLTIIELVGRGTFGDVYRAWDSRLDREVALKLLRRREPDDEARASAVVHEGRLLARVRHPNVVTVYGAERVDGQVGMWMEFIHGKTLEEELRDNGPFDAGQAARVGIELCDALSAVHRASLIHRDVKAHNVMRDRDGRLMLTDFGTGCELEETPAGADPQFAGTPLYLAPEVLERKVATPQSDIYSLGVLLYHLVTGTYPVRGRSLKDVREAHARGVRIALRDARPDLPAAFADIVDRALDADPQHRYENPEALRAALAALVSTNDAERPPTGRSAGHRWKHAAIAAALVVLASLGTLWTWKGPETPAIVVLPLKNLSADADSEYFVDGLTGEIIRNLSGIVGLDVRSQTSSFMFKNKPRNIRDVGQQLQATHVVEGQVLRSNGKLRVSVSLVRVADDTTLWSKVFDRDQKDVFAIQDEISRTIVNELRLTLGRGQRRYEANLEAYELYLKAVALVDPHYTRRAPEAIDLFEQVIAKDPAFAPAYAGLANAWAVMSINYAGVAPDEAYAKMRPAAEKALQLDPLLAEAHAAMGLVLARDRRWVDSEAAFRRAIDLNRRLPFVYRSFALWTLFPQGKLDEALWQLRVALRADPLSLDVRRAMAWVEVSARHYDDAIANCRRVLGVDPDSPHEKQSLARALLQKGKVAEAIALLEPMGPSHQQILGYAYAVSGRVAEAEKLAAQHIGLPARLVVIYAGLGDKDRTFEALEQMAARNDPKVGQYLTYPELALLRGDPRLAAFRRKLGLPGA